MKLTSSTTSLRLLLSLTTLTAGLALAQQNEERPPGPPTEAVNACSGLSKGTACAFTFNGKNLTGTCDAPPDKSTLACRPEGGPGGPGGHRGPPQEAITACASSTENATCSFAHDGNTVSGTCAKPPHGGTQLACRPAGGPQGGPGGHRGPPQEAITACASSSANATCSFTIGSRTVSGTCAAPPNGGSLACRPSDMGPPPDQR